MSVGRLFHSIISREVPRSGEVWAFHDEAGPWASKRGHEVTILDFRKGWVRYKWNDSIMWQDERMKWGEFLYCYDRISP